jgi:multimeric flavodoxin WrbA
MMDRLVCADGGNPDPTSTHGKTAAEAKALELAGWPYPRHLAGRIFSVVVHGDTVGAETLRRSLSDWASDLHMVSAGAKGELDGYIGYFEPYATSHEALDDDTAFQKEVTNATSTLLEAGGSNTQWAARPGRKHAQGAATEIMANGNLARHWMIAIILLKSRAA